MSFRATANALFVSSLLAGLSAIASSQSDLSDSTTVVSCLTERAGKLLVGKGGDTYILEGHTAELKAHVGDELSVSGQILYAGSECIGETCEYALRVTNFKTLVRKNHAGVQPRLGDPKHWSTLTDKNFGVMIRTPKTFIEQKTAPTNADSSFVDHQGTQTLQTWIVPREIYPGSNFEGGTFEVTVNPAIRSEGTCSQFGASSPERTFSKTLGGIRYTQSQTGSVAAGTAYSEYHLHTFQNGFCYEFSFEFAESDGTGIDETCSIQWLTSDNEQSLLNELLSEAAFVTPNIKSPIGPLPKVDGSRSVLH